MPSGSQRFDLPADVAIARIRPNSQLTHTPKIARRSNLLGTRDIGSNIGSNPRCGLLTSFVDPPVPSAPRLICCGSALRIVQATRPVLRAGASVRTAQPTLAARTGNPVPYRSRSRSGTEDLRALPPPPRKPNRQGCAQDRQPSGTLRT